MDTCIMQRMVLVGSDGGEVPGPGPGWIGLVDGGHWGIRWWRWIVQNEFGLYFLHAVVNIRTCLFFSYSVS